MGRPTVSSGVPLAIAQPGVEMLPPDIDLAQIADPWQQRVVAISLVAAIRASVLPPLQLQAALPPVEGPGPFTMQLPSPDEFRRQHLPDGVVLAPHQVDGWVRAQALRDGPPSWYFMDVSVPEAAIDHVDSDGVVLTPGTKLRWDPSFTRTREPDDGAGRATGAGVSTPQMGRRYVEYVAPPLSERQYVAVASDRVLDRVRLLSFFYRSVWAWSPAQGVLFVLTGLIPYAERWAEEVAIQHGRRPRPMSTKHLELGVFAARRSAGGGQQGVAEREAGVAERMSAWNALHPEWLYENVDQFSSDAARALRKLGGLVRG